MVYKNFRMFEIVSTLIVKLQSALRSLNTSVLMQYFVKKKNIEKEKETANNIIRRTIYIIKYMSK